MTIDRRNTDHCKNGGQNATPQPSIELVADVWFIIMNLLSPSDIVRLGLTCRALFEYSQDHHVWHNALVKHRFLPKSYPHLCHTPASVIRRQLFTTASIDAAFAQPTLAPIRTHSFPLEFPGVFQGMKFVPGGDWLVLLFHSKTLNPARHSNICLFKPPLMTSLAKDTAPTSVTLQSEWCWLHLGPRDGPYKSSRGDDLLLLRAFVKNDRTFAICHLDTKTPSVKITFLVRTPLSTRNHIVGGDYLIYGWVTDDHKHMVRIMKLNRDYTTLDKDVIAEIDCPPEYDEKLMVRYDLCLSGKLPKLLLITTFLMVAYDISDDILTLGSQSSPIKLPGVWKYTPEKVSFGRILHVLQEGVVMALYEGKIRLIYPDIDDPEPDKKTIPTYEFSSPTPHSTNCPVVFTSQRIFWPLRSPRPGPAVVNSKHLIETATLPIPNNEERTINRIVVDHEELAPAQGSLVHETQDWDELSGRLCIRYARSKYPHDQSLRRTSWRIVILEMV